MRIRPFALSGIRLFQPAPSSLNSNIWIIPQYFSTEIHLSFCSFFPLQKRKFSPQVHPCVYPTKENESRKIKKKQDITQEKTEETNKDILSIKKQISNKTKQHSVTLKIFLFQLEIENKVFKSLHFKVREKDSSAFVPKLLRVFRKTQGRFKQNSFAFDSERQSDFSRFSFFILYDDRSIPLLPPLQMAVAQVRFSDQKRQLHR